MTPIPVTWRQWGPPAFEEARRTERPVLLSLGTPWCAGCAQMRRSTYADPAVGRVIAARVIPVGVDADRRPDIGDRYALGAWPTTVFLTPSGVLLGGETFVEASRMTDLVTRVADAYASRRDELATAEPSVLDEDPPAEPTAADGAADDNLDEWLTAQLLERFDDDHGGFGGEPKRLHASAIEFTIRRCASGTDRLTPVVRRTLDAVGWSAVSDGADGGVFRYSAGTDWSRPCREKTLAGQADALRSWLMVWRLLGDTRYRERARDLIGYVRVTLLEPEHGGFFSGQLAETSGAEASIYADGTARMAAAYVLAAETFADESLLQCAATALERVVLPTYERGAGIAHQANDPDSARGLLVDHVTVGSALLDLYAATDREVYLDMAQELMLFAGRALWDETPAGFVDRRVDTGDVGLLRLPLVPFGLNCDAAALLGRLAGLTGNESFGRRRDAILSSRASRVRA
jgi:uncharacterized protein YyaL (SSP411 family)